MEAQVQQQFSSSTWRMHFHALETLNTAQFARFFTYDEDGFRSYRPITEAADYGNQMCIFSELLPTILLPMGLEFKAVQSSLKIVFQIF